MKKAKVGMRFQRVISLVGPVLMSSGLLVMSLPAAALDQPSLASSAKSTKSQYTAPVVEVAEDHPAQVLSRHTAVSTSDVDVSTDDDFSDGVSGIATTHAVATASDKVISTSSANKSQQSTSPKKKTSPSSSSAPSSPPSSSSSTGSSSNGSTPKDTTSTPLPKRVKRLEQQMNNLVGMNIPDQLTNLQQQVRQLRGQLQDQAHDIKLLNQQLRRFYQELDQRINQVKNLSDSGGDSASDNTSSSTPVAALGAGSTDDNSTNVTDQLSIQEQDRQAYQAATHWLTKKSNAAKQRLAKSEAKLRDYLNDYPNGNYVADAHYWLGELYFKGKAYAKAKREWLTVIHQYPKSKKRIDAKLKLAQVYLAQGQRLRAAHELRAIQQEYPQTSAAKLAAMQLENLKK